MQIQGKILAVDERKRTITMLGRRQKRILYFQRAMFSKFEKYLHPNFFIALSFQRKHKTNQKAMHTVRNVKKIIKPTVYGPKVLYSFKHLKNQTKSFVNQLGMKLFLDFEMSMHPYYKQKNFVQEIIQVGYILQDKEGKVLKTFSACIKPTRHETLSKRTLKFLDLTQDDVDQGMSYETFYNHLKNLINTYKPAIIVWGRNDMLALRDSYKINHKRTLAKKTRFVNLLKLHKNYFNLKNDVGLLSAFERYGHQLKQRQKHDALEDAYMTKKVFEGFKHLINCDDNQPPLF